MAGQENDSREKRRGANAWSSELTKEEKSNQEKCPWTIF